MVIMFYLHYMYKKVENFCNGAFDLHEVCKKLEPLNRGAMQSCIIFAAALLYTVFWLTYYLFCRKGGDRMSTERNFENRPFNFVTSAVCLSARNGWRTAEWGYDI